MTSFWFSDPRLTACVRGASRSRDGAVKAAVDFLFDGSYLFAHVDVWTDAAVRQAVAKVLTAQTGIADHELVEDLAKLERQIADGATQPGFLSAGTREGVQAERNERDLVFRTARELAAAAPSEVAWIAKPWIARGAFTELDGKVKASGKTTLLTHLVRCVLDGLPFMGQPTLKSKVVYLTEQGDSSFKEALRRAGLQEREDLVILSWKDTISVSWPHIMQAALVQCQRLGAVLLVVDTLPQFAGFEGEAENSSGAALEASRPLLEASAVHGLGVIASRHERKSGGEVGDSGRGSSAFGGAADIVMSLRRAAGNASPNLRVIHAIGRYDDIPATLVIELTANGYRSLGSEHALGVHRAREALEDALPRGGEEAVTLEELAASTGMMGRSSLQEALKAMEGEAQVSKTGKGMRGSPFRYYHT